MKTIFTDSADTNEHFDPLSSWQESSKNRLSSDQKRMLTRALKRVPTKNFYTPVLNWFKQYGRKSLPWQQSPTPYRVWVSEVMLQQTQVSTVLEYFEKFMRTFPDVHSLAKAHSDAVLSLWTGLGYYSRARNLHKTAKIIHAEYQGNFPKTVTELEALPGIGRSTAGAIISLSQNIWAPILDGNVKRVLARVHCVSGAVQETKVQHLLWALSTHYTPKHAAKQFNQAMMDIGATLCTRANPSCELCPLSEQCAAKAKQQTHSYPQKRINKTKKNLGIAFLIIKTSRGAVLLEKRPESGIWGGLWGFPEFQDTSTLNQYCSHFFPQAKCYHLKPFKHVFTHFNLNIHPTVVNISKQQTVAFEDRAHRVNRWFTPEKVNSVGLAAPVKRLIAQLDFES